MASIGESKQIQIVRFSGAKNSAGDVIETPSTLYSGWAEVINQSGTRRFIDRPVSEKNYLFRIKYRPLIVPTLNDTVVYGGRRYTVQDVSRSDEKKFTYEILANGSL